MESGVESLEGQCADRSLDLVALEVVDLECVGDAVLFGRFFFFQAEDGIRDATVTGVQTCALPIFPKSATGDSRYQSGYAKTAALSTSLAAATSSRTEPLRVGRNSKATHHTGRGSISSKSAALGVAARRIAFPMSAIHGSMLASCLTPRWATTTTGVIGRSGFPPTSSRRVFPGSFATGFMRCSR